MAVTESSAIARFIDSVRAEPIRPSKRIEIPPVPTEAVMVPPKKSHAKLFVVLLLLGGLVAGGVYLARSGKGAELVASAKALAGVDSDSSSSSSTPAQPIVNAPLPAEGEGATAPAAGGATDEKATAALPHDAGVDIIINPVAAQVRLDGRELGKSPLRVSRLTPGTHVLQVDAPEGYLSKQEDVVLESGRSKRIEITLDAVGAPAAAPAVVSGPIVTPIAAEGSADESDDGADPDDSDEPATPKAKAKAKTKAAKRTPPKKRTERTVATSGKSGTLMIGSKPSCQIYVDGSSTGKSTPQRALKLSAGQHTIVLVNKDFGIKKKLRVNIKPGQSTRVIKDLSDYMN